MRFVRYGIATLLGIAVARATEYAADPFRFGLGARPLALAESFTALASGPEAVYWNPAGLVGSPRSLLLQHEASFGGLASVEGLALSLPHLGPLAFGLGLQLFLSGGIRLTTLPDTTEPPGPENPPQARDTVGYGAYALYLAGAAPLGEGRVGGALKLLYQGGGGASAYGLGFDVGYRLQGLSFSLGLLARDLTTTPLFWSTGTTQLIQPSFEADLAYQFQKATASFGFQMLWESREEERFAWGPLTLFPRLGVELTPWPFLSLRGGYGRSLTFGAGLHIRKLRLDYALLLHPLGASHRASLSFDL